MWKDPAHPLRHHPKLQLKGIPTLVRWQGNGPTARLGHELEAASTAEQADELIRDFLSRDRQSDGPAAAATGERAVDVQELIKQLDQASFNNGIVAH